MIALAASSSKTSMECFVRFVPIGGGEGHLVFSGSIANLLSITEPSEEALFNGELLPQTLGSRQFQLRRESHSAAPSRYSKEFVEEGRLGRGGFGEVFRARNKVDGQPYAIKKIKATSRSALDPVLSEVTVLSRLNHPNVVRYFTSWIYDGVEDQGRDDSDLSEEEVRRFIFLP